MLSTSPEGMSAAPEPIGTSHLQGNIGFFNLVFTVLAYNGPMVVFLGFIPVSILLGNGIGTPAMYLFCGVIAVLFASGMVAMGLRLPKPGGFYTFVSAGLGKVAGLGTGFTAMVCYYSANVSAYALAGVATDSLISGALHGPSVPWWLYSLVFFVIVTVLGYLNISFSAKVLTIFLALELGLMIIYDASVIAQGGANGFNLESFQPSSIFSGSITVAFIFGVGLYGGFEATVIFRDEVKKPKRTIPRATYAVVAILALLYGLTAWVFINAYGTDAIMSVLSKNLVSASSDSVRQYTGEVAYFSADVLLITSSFALILASHNITSRYLYNLSADGVLPRALSRVHERFGSPHRASVALSILSLIGIVAFGILGLDGSTVYARLAGIYSYCFVILLVVAAAAIAVFLFRDKSERKAWLPAAATSIAFVFLAVALVLATMNFDLLAGTSGVATFLILLLIWGLVAVGVILALVYRSRRPDVYSRIGRDDAGDMVPDPAESFSS
ncbi:APC family permease [Microbacterium sp. X-17]|uniref:APC family permease n=1 Tax=Microbacterium sp. X-17 TaxID=3144404 RepID=UPI0031F52748